MHASCSRGETRLEGTNGIVRARARYVGEPNRAGRVLETQPLRSILFFSVLRLAHSIRSRPIRSSSASDAPSGDIECRVNGTRSIRYEFHDALTRRP